MWRITALSFMNHKKITKYSVGKLQVVHIETTILQRSEPQETSDYPLTVTHEVLNKEGKVQAT